MDNKEAKLPKIKSLTKVKAPIGIVGLKNNSSFCGAVFNQNKIASIVDDGSSPFQERSDLIYGLAPSSGYDQDVLARIIELLLQLRAAQSDQNVFVQNNTVVREQILSQLKNEILRVNNRLTKSQVKNLEVVSSNSFDAKVENGFYDAPNLTMKGINLTADDLYNPAAPIRFSAQEVQTVSPLLMKPVSVDMTYFENHN